MKTKQAIYFLLIVVGMVIAGISFEGVPKEYTLSIGLVLLLFGIYKMSGSWSSSDTKDEES